MSKKKKNSDHDKSLKTIIMVTAILSLINSLIGLIQAIIKLIE